MRETINITEAREKFLQLPEKMSPGEEIKVSRNRKTVLLIRKPNQEEGKPSKLSILSEIIQSMPKTHGPKKDISSNMKEYLYGKYSKYAQNQRKRYS